MFQPGEAGDDAVGAVLGVDGAVPEVAWAAGERRERGHLIFGDGCPGVLAQRPLHAVAERRIGDGDGGGLGGRRLHDIGGRIDTVCRRIEVHHRAPVLQRRDVRLVGSRVQRVGCQSDVVAGAELLVLGQRRDIDDMVFGQDQIVQGGEAAQRRDVGDGVDAEAQVRQRPEFGERPDVCDGIGAEAKAGQRREAGEGREVRDRVQGCMQGCQRREAGEGREVRDRVVVDVQRVQRREAGEGREVRDRVADEARRGEACRMFQSGEAGDGTVGTAPSAQCAAEIPDPGHFLLGDGRPGALVQRLLDAVAERRVRYRHGVLCRRLGETGDKSDQQRGEYAHAAHLQDYGRCTARLDSRGGGRGDEVHGARCCFSRCRRKRSTIV